MLYILSSVAPDKASTISSSLVEAGARDGSILLGLLGSEGFDTCNDQGSQGRQKKGGGNKKLGKEKTVDLGVAICRFHFDALQLKQRYLARRP